MSIEPKPAGDPHIIRVFAQVREQSFFERDPAPVEPAPDGRWASFHTKHLDEPFFRLRTRSDPERDDGSYSDG